jgi:hypothetical protein
VQYKNSNSRSLRYRDGVILLAPGGITTAFIYLTIMIVVRIIVAIFMAWLFYYYC